VFRTKSKTEQAKQKLALASETSAATVQDQFRERVVPAVGHAAVAAKDWGKPRVDAARDWAKPRVEHGIEVAAPRLENAVDSLAPKVDTARDRIVEDLLPRVAEAIAAAAAASAASAAAARNEAVTRGSDAAAVLAGNAVAKPRHRKRKAFLVVSLLGAAAAGFAAFKKGQAPKEDPWATPLQEPYVAPTTGRATTVPTGTAPQNADTTAAGAEVLGTPADESAEELGANNESLSADSPLGDSLDSSKKPGEGSTD